LELHEGHRDLASAARNPILQNGVILNVSKNSFHAVRSKLGLVVVQGPGQLLLFDPETNKEMRSIAAQAFRINLACH
jgi:hypothetical protein